LNQYIQGLSTNSIYKHVEVFINHMPVFKVL
jgi:hypothetical protein